MEGALEIFQMLLGSLAKDIDQSIGSAEMLSDRARAGVLVISNGPVVDFAPVKPVHAMIEERAARTPDRIAVESQGEQFTYAQLNAAAERLASRLAREGVGADDRVALILNRSPEAIVAMIAVLKSGACYVPIDPADAPARLAGILREASPRLVLAHSTAAPNASFPTIRLGIEEARGEIDFGAPISSSVCLQDLAYVIYTSGSSGLPKGVMVEHHSLANYARAAARHFEITPEDRVLQFASLSFDACGEEIYPCLTTGATLVLRTNEMIGSAAQFLQQCAELAITVLDLPTAYWHHLVESMDSENLRLPARVRLLIIGGEAASVDAWDRWCSMEKRVRVVNTYGARAADRQARAKHGGVRPGCPPAIAADGWNRRTLSWWGKRRARILQSP
jgi:non-ribosomal peptide synthetase component F